MRQYHGKPSERVSSERCARSIHTRNAQAEIAEMRAYYAAIVDKYLPAALDF